MPLELKGRPIQLGALDASPQRMIVVDFDMSFLHMVTFIVKAAIAAIPAAIILFVVGALAVAVLGVGSFGPGR
jgi:hypothetical protein